MEHIVNFAVFIAVLGGLIFTHELGHFLVAKWLGVKVEEFGIGLPPKARRLGQWRGTVFTLNWIPLGGFIRPAGENDSNIAGGLAASAPWRRLAILSAGSAANLLLGLAILSVGFMTGWPEQVRIVQIAEGSPAQVAGILAEDMILEINGQAMRSPSAAAEIFKANLGSPVQLTLLRGDVVITKTIIPDMSWSSDERPTGMSMTYGLLSHPLFTAVGRAWNQMIIQVQETLSLPWRLLNQQTQAENVRLMSPVGLKQVSDRVVQNSLRWNEWFPILSLTATISIALGIANMLPIPALDGGRILFVVIEIVRGQRVNPRVERWAQITGLLAVFGLTIVLAVQDILFPLF